MSARFSIHPGKEDQFRELATRCVERVRGREPGTLQYDWFVNGDGSVCVVREAYRDSDAVLAHAGNVGPLLAEFPEVCDAEFEVCGNAQSHLVEALSVFRVRCCTPL